MRSTIRRTYLKLVTFLTLFGEMILETGNRIESALPLKWAFRFRGAFDLGRHVGENGSPRAGLRRIRAGQGLTREMQAVVGFFALAVVGNFVLAEIDTNLPDTADQNYSDAGNDTASGWEDAIGIAVVVPLVVFAGIMLGVIMRFV